jgi:hypothetical protein
MPWISFFESSLTKILDHDEKSISALKRMVKTQYSRLMALRFMVFDFLLQR